MPYQKRSFTLPARPSASRTQLKGRPGIHHYSWEFADFKRLGDVLDTFGRCLAWGPGRHGAGDNVFAYYVDAGGFMV